MGGGRVTVANIGTEKEETLPQSFELFENYPNPFEESTTIGFALPEHAHVVMKIFDMLGREVETVADDSSPPVITPWHSTRAASRAGPMSWK